MLCCIHGHENFLQFLLESVPPFELTEEFIKEFVKGCDIDDDGTDDDEEVNKAATIETTQMKGSQRQSTVVNKKSEVKHPYSATVDTSSHSLQSIHNPFPEFHDDQRPTTPFESRPTTPLSFQLPPLLCDREMPSTNLYKDLELLSFDGNYLLACNQENGKAPLHYAIESGKNPRIIAYLLAIDQRCVLLQDKEGRTPLHIACMKNKMSIVKQLLAVPLTNPCVRDNSGKRPEALSSNPAIKRKVDKVASCDLNLGLKSNTGLNHRVLLLGLSQNFVCRFKIYQLMATELITCYQSYKPLLFLLFHQVVHSLNVEPHYKT
jgi:hypothetical protein